MGSEVRLLGLDGDAAAGINSGSFRRGLPGPDSAVMLPCNPAAGCDAWRSVEGGSGGIYSELLPPISFFTRTPCGWGIVGESGIAAAARVRWCGLGEWHAKHGLGAASGLQVYPLAVHTS